MTKSILTPVAIAELSNYNVPLNDYDYAFTLAKSDTTLMAEDSEAYVEFRFFEHNYSVLITLGRVFAEVEDDRLLDPDVFILLIDNGFSKDFADVVLLARREGYTYLILDPGLAPCPSLPKYNYEALPKHN